MRLQAEPPQRKLRRQSSGVSKVGRNELRCPTGFHCISDDSSDDIVIILTQAGTKAATPTPCRARRMSSAISSARHCQYAEYKSHARCNSLGANPQPRLNALMTNVPATNIFFRPQRSASLPKRSNKQPYRPWRFSMRILLTGCGAHRAESIGVDYPLQSLFRYMHVASNGWESDGW